MTTITIIFVSILVFIYILFVITQLSFYRILIAKLKFRVEHGITIQNYLSQQWKIQCIFIKGDEDGFDGEYHVMTEVIKPNEYKFKYIKNCVEIEIYLRGFKIAKLYNNGEILL